MVNMYKIKTAVTAIIFIILSSYAGAQTQGLHCGNKILTISGYYKNLFSTSKTTSAGEHFFSDLNRLRLQFRIKPNSNLEFLFTLDNEVLFNDFSNTSDFNTIRQKDQRSIASMDTDYVSRDRKHTFIRHLLYRAYLKYKNDSFHPTIGKQNIDYSRMRFFGPLDLFNPQSPLDVEQEERTGTDAINLEYFTGATSSLNIVAAPASTNSESSFGMRLLRKYGDYDLSFVAGEFRKDEIAGFGFDGYILVAGLRGEFMYSHSDNGNDFARIALGADYSPSPRLYILGEYFYNGGASSNISHFMSSYKYSRRMRSIKKHLLSFMVKYEITPLLTFEKYMIYDPQGKSAFFNPQIRYNILTNIDITCGLQLFTGGSNSEFGNYKNLYYTEIKYFF